ncbi:MULTISPECIES: outer membrane beta-barrel protein [Butyricimonas]|uniref:outer membrane beta-barrel protein n=1 Tax=Butyricimonas TaxID=574697 RepID=UPI0007FB4EB8|nr:MULTISPECIES: outer membrane beta-barrel protein [Butyricimonas]
MSENLEKLFKNALEQVSVEPPARVWERIDSHFVMKQRRLRRIYTYSGVAAAIILLLCITFLIPDKQTGIYPLAPVATLNPIDNSQNENQILAFTSTPRSIPAITRKREIRFTETDTRMLVPVQLNMSSLDDLRVEQPEKELKMPAVRGDFIPLVNGNALENQKKYLALLGGHEIVENAPKVKPTKEERIFMVGGYISPGYSSGSYHVNNENARSAQYDNSQMTGIFNLGGGLTFAVKPSKRISIETGLGYSRMGQKTSDAQVFVPRGDMVSYTTNTHAYTPLGNVKNQAKATVSTSENYLSLKGDQDEEGSIEQQFDAIEIPLAFRFHLNDNKIRFSILGGLGASFLVRNHTYVNYSGKKELMGEAEDIRTFNISTNVGLGIEYPLSKSIRLKLEPGFKYYLQSLSKNSNIDFKPYSFTFSTGIGINF